MYVFDLHGSFTMAAFLAGIYGSFKSFGMFQWNSKYITSVT